VPLLKACIQKFLPPDRGASARQGDGLTPHLLSCLTRGNAPRRRRRTTWYLFAHSGNRMLHKTFAVYLDIPSVPISGSDIHQHAFFFALHGARWLCVSADSARITQTRLLGSLCIISALRRRRRTALCGLPPAVLAASTSWRRGGSSFWFYVVHFCMRFC